MIIVRLLILTICLICSDLLFAKEIVLDIDFVSEDNGMPSELSRPYVEATLNQEPIQMLFDTGFEVAEIGVKKEFLSRLTNITYLKKKKCAQNAFGRPKCRQLFTASSLKLGELDLFNVTGVVFDDKISENQNIQAVIGLPLINQYQVLIDYPGHQIIFNPDQTRDKHFTKAATFFFESKNRLETQLIVNKVRMKFFWDTGAMSCASITRLYPWEYNKCPIDFGVFPFCTVLRIADDQSSELPQTWFLVMPLLFSGIDGVIGAQFFHKYPIKIDFIKKEIVVYNNNIYIT